MANCVQVLDAYAPLGDDVDSVKRDVIMKLRPQWPLDRIQHKVISGGYVNEIRRYQLDTDSALEDALAVRLFGPCGDAGMVDHERELLYTQISSRAGCFPPVLATLANGIVYPYVAGSCMEQRHMRDPHVAGLVATNLAQLHYADVGPGTLRDRHGNPATPDRSNDFFRRLYRAVEMFPDTLPNPLLQQRVSRDMVPLEEIRREIRHLEEHIGSLALETAFCHFDFHSRNNLYDPKSAAGFPTSGTLMEDEERLLWVRPYLRRKFQLLGRDPADLRQHDIDKLMLEIRITDVALGLVYACVLVDLLPYKPHLINCVPLVNKSMSLYYEMKPQLASLAGQYRSLQTSDPTPQDN